MLYLQCKVGTGQFLIGHKVGQSMGKHSFECFVILAKFIQLVFIQYLKKHLK